MNAEKIKTQKQLINFIKSLDLNQLFVSEIDVQFNRDKYLEDAKSKGKTIECFRVIGEEFTDEYLLTNVEMLSEDKKIEYGFKEE